MTYFIKYKGRLMDVKKVQQLKAKELAENTTEATVDIEEETTEELEENVNNVEETVEVVVEPVEEEKESDLDARKAFIEENGKLDKRWKEKRIIEESDKLGFGN